MPTIMDKFEYYLFQQGKCPETVRLYLSRVKHFLKWRDEYYKKTDLKVDVTKGQVEAYEDHCIKIKKYAPSGISHRLSAINAYIGFLTNQTVTDSFQADDKKCVNKADQQPSRGNRPRIHERKNIIV